MVESIRARTVGQAWVAAGRRVLQKGKRIMDGKEPLLEIAPLIISIGKPLEKDPIIRKYGNKEMIKNIDDVFFKLRPMKFGWSYGERLFDYGGVDQVRGVISKLKGKPETKAAVLTLLDPQQDSKSSHVPCITSLDFKVRNKRLVTYAIFRSQDVGKKTYADMIAIGKLQKLISGSVGVQPGRLTLFITSAHIYKADIPAVSSVIRQIRCSRQ